MNVVDEDLGVPVLVLVLVAEGQAEHLTGTVLRSLQFNLLKVSGEVRKSCKRSDI